MNKIIAAMMAAGVIASASTALAAEGEFYTGAQKPQASSVDRMATGSIHNRQDVKPKTSRDNREIFDGQGSYYQGVERPR